MPFVLPPVLFTPRARAPFLQRRSDGVVLPHAPPHRAVSATLSQTDCSNTTAFPPSRTATFWRTFKLLDDRPSARLTAIRLTASLLLRLPFLPARERTFWLVGLRRSLFYFLFRIPVYLSGAIVFQMLRKDASQMDLLRPRAVEHALTAYHTLSQDLQHMQAGTYPFPWLQGSWMKELNIIHAFYMLFLYLKRRSEAFVRFASDDIYQTTWLSGDMYPSYYTRTFHFQRDGFFSDESATFYDVESEDFFLGLQDAMQRLSLVPIASFLSRRTDLRPPHIVEVGCGTGRFATFLRDAFPAAKFTLSDASPFYLQRARRNMYLWETHSNITKEKATLGTAVFMQALAEKLPLHMASVDVVLAQYLFHEIPPEARRDVVYEMARVIKEGGVFIITDSAQPGDQHVIVKGAEIFKSFDEPYYASYVSEDFVQLVCGNGWFVPVQSETRFVTKTMAFERSSNPFE